MSLRLICPLVLAATAVASEAIPEWTMANKTPNLRAMIDHKLEVKRPLKFGMIKLTDCIPIVAAKELGYFADEGLNVAVEVQPNWAAVRDRVLSGELDGSHMLYGHPLGAAIGFNMPAADLVVPFNLSINGMGISIAATVWDEMAKREPTLAKPGYPQPVSAAPLKEVAAAAKGKGAPLTMFMTFPAGSHNMTLRYWLAAGGVHPGFYTGLDDAKGVSDAEVMLQTNPPPQMVSAMNTGNCQGFCVGEPWNMQLTIKEGTGRLAIASNHVFNGSPDKVFAMKKSFVEQNPNTTRAVVRALIRAARWLDASTDNRRTAAAMLAHKSYIGANVNIIAESITGTLVYNVTNGVADRRAEPDFNIFYRRFASFPFHSHAVWGLTQFRRWGMIPENKPDAWYADIAAKTFRADIYRDAFASLEKEGVVKADELPAQDALSYAAEAFIDKIPFDPAKPNEYIARFAIGRK